MQNSRHKESISKSRTLYSLRSRMAASFALLFAGILVLVSLARTFGIPGTLNTGSYGRERSMVFRNLSLVADLKKERLAMWVHERKGDLQILARSHALILYVEYFDKLSSKMTGDGAERSAFDSRSFNNEIYQAARTRLETKVEAYSIYEKIQLASAQGRIILSTDKRDLGENISGADFFATALRASEKSPVLIEVTKAAKKPYLVISRALRRPFGDGADDAAPLGVVIMYIDADAFVKPLLYTGGGLGKSGEVVLVDEKLEILVSLKHQLPGQSEVSLFKYSMKDKPARFALAGKEGITEGEDYRGKTVLAAYRTIEVTPDSIWGMVVKVDESEIFSPVRRELLFSFALGLAGIILAGGLALWMADRIAQPIRRLSRTAREVSSGNLSVRAPVSRWDEVGALADTFNSMIARIQNWRDELEEQVKIRTDRLSEVNKELADEIYERKVAQETIKAQNDFLKNVVESLNHPFYVVDASDYQVVLANAAAKEAQRRRSFSESPSDKTDQSPENEDPVYPIKEVIETGNPAMAERMLHDSQGSPYFVEAHAHPVFDDQGHVAQVIEYAFDITERKAFEKDRENLISELEAKNAELERFTYTVSHDLSSPLITIKTFTGFINEALDEGNFENVRPDLQRVISATDKMTTLLQELLELSRIGRVVNSPTEVDMNELIREVVTLLEGSIMKCKASVIIKPHLPAVIGDRPRLVEVAQNLIENALKFLGNNDDPEVEIGCLQQGQESVFYVKDNGMGIDPKYRERVFRLFDKLDRDTQGTGIGLALVKRIIEVHGGRIWLESEGLGHGATFFFTIPSQSETNSQPRAKDH